MVSASEAAEGLGLGRARGQSLAREDGGGCWRGKEEAAEEELELAVLN